MSTMTLKIKGMSCGHCATTVNDALEGVDGVQRAQVDLDAGRAEVEYDESAADAKTLVGAVMDHGYTAEEATN